MATQAELDALMGRIEANRAQDPGVDVDPLMQRIEALRTRSAPPDPSFRPPGVPQPQAPTGFVGPFATGETMLEDIRRFGPSIAKGALTMGAERLGQIGGAAAGGLLFGPPGAVPGAMAGGALMAPVGMTAGRLATGEPLPTLEELTMEAGLSLVPEVALPVLKTAGRSILRSLPGGKLIRFQEAANRARKKLPQIFDPPEKEVVQAKFEQLRNAGVQADLTQFTGRIADLGNAKFRDLLKDVRSIDRDLKNGGKFETALRNARQKTVTTTTTTPPPPGTRFAPQPVTQTTQLTANLDLGELQQLRSELGKRVEDLGPLGPAEARQLLKDAQRDIDEVIDETLINTEDVTGLPPNFAREARRDWQRFKAAEVMTEAIEDAITSTPDLSMQSFNVRRFFDTLRKDRTKEARNINRTLRQIPGAKAAFDAEIADIAKLFETIEMPMTQVSGFSRNEIVAGLGQVMSLILLNPAGRALFREAILKNDGVVTPATLEVIVSALRRQGMAGPQAAPAPTPERPRANPPLTLEANGSALANGG